MSNEQESASNSQKNMLTPMVDDSGKFYGYCGLNTSSTPGLTIKSVGGLAQRMEYGGIEPVVGIAEYTVTSANRYPTRLSAPRDVITSWAQKQIDLVLGGTLTDGERDSAFESLGKVVEDARSIFFSKSNIGGLGYQEFRAALLKYRLAIFPGNIYDQHENKFLYTSLPVISGEIRLKSNDIEFDQFTLLSHFYIRELPKSDLSTEFLLNDRWSIIVYELQSSGVRFEIEFKNNVRIGKYLGIASARHRLKRNGQVSSDAVFLRLLD